MTELDSVQILNALLELKLNRRRILGERSAFLLQYLSISNNSYFIFAVFQCY